MKFVRSGKFLQLEDFCINLENVLEFLKEGCLPLGRELGTGSFWRGRGISHCAFFLYFLNVKIFKIHV